MRRLNCFGREVNEIIRCNDFSTCLTLLSYFCPFLHSILLSVFLSPFLSTFLSLSVHLSLLPLPPSLSFLSQFLRVEQDKECNMECTGGPRKPLCASDGRTFSSRCEFLRAKCRDPQLEVIRGPCKGQAMSHASAPRSLANEPRVTAETSFQHN